MLGLILIILQFSCSQWYNYRYAAKKWEKNKNPLTLPIACDVT